MAGRAIHWLLVIGFSVATGHLAWHTLVGCPLSPEYLAGGEVSALTGPNPENRHLYLRRTVYLSHRPRSAWIQVLGHDRIQLFVNGKFVEKHVLDGFPVAIVADLAPYLQVGPNVIAIHAKQSTVDKPPIVSVEGAYTLADGEHTIQTDRSWRCSSTFERQASWWFTNEFDERRWPFAEVATCYLRAKVNSPPRAVTTATVGRWITPVHVETGSASLRREFDVAGRPRQAWLRMTATSPYRLAVNGILLDQQEDRFGVRVPNPPVQRTYDITSVVQRGKNVLALSLTDSVSPPHLLADMEVEDQAGACHRVGTDERWMSRAGLSSNWQNLALDDSASWRPCNVESGDLNIPPWSIQRQVMQVSLPLTDNVRQAAEQVGVIILIAFLTHLACRLAVACMLVNLSELEPGARLGIAALALVPPTLAISGALLATYDPRFARQDVYQASWLYLALVSVPLQWGLLWLLAFGHQYLLRSTGRCEGQRLRVGALFVLLFALTLIGFWLRFRDLGTEALQWDEVENYNATRGFLKRGFPSLEVHKDLPILHVHTSELEFVFHALVAMCCDDPAMIVRLPSVCFSTLTIGLIYLVGRRMFNAPIGLTAAVLYTFAPGCITMSTIGRYFAELQFFTLLAVYFVWQTVRGSGQISTRDLWLTAASFMAMFFSWEASALVAPGVIVAALVQRRGRLQTIFSNLSVWAALLLVLLAFVLQRSLATFAQTQFLWYGISLSEVRLLPMWRYQGFQPWYYIWESSWNQDTLLPLLGLAGALFIAVQHVYRRPVRFLLLVHLTTCLLMAFTLPNTQFRYVYHLIPLLILLCSATAIAAARGLIHLARQAGPRTVWQTHARGIGVVFALTFIVFAGGMPLELRQMDRFRIEGMCPRLFKFPDLSGPAKYVRDHMREGDIVLANNMYQIRHLMGSIDQQPGFSEFMVETGPFFLPATLDDVEGSLVDRRDGVRLISSPESLADLFAHHSRIWYIVQPGQHYILNTPTASSFLRQHMDVVFEDWEALVLFRGEAHRAVYTRLKDDKTLNEAQATFLP